MKVIENISLMYRCCGVLNLDKLPMSIHYRREYYRDMLFVKNLRLKAALNKLMKILPYNSGFDVFLEAFKLYFPYLWDDITNYCESKRQDYFRRRKKGLRTVRFYKPADFLKKHISLKLKGVELLSGAELLKFKSDLLANAEKKQRSRKEKLKKNMVMVQKVCPSYAKRLIKLYFDIRKNSTLNVNARYLILLEASQFKCKETIGFLQKVNACDKNDDLRNLAFFSLQRLGVLTWLSRKRKGKKKLSQITPIDIEKNPTELLHFICDNQHLLHQKYDVFLSHSSQDVQELLRIKAELNRQGKSVYIDWVNDHIMMDRKNQNSDTWNVLETRMQQSLQMVYVLTENSVQSPSTEREVRFFKEQGKLVLIYEPRTLSIPRPNYLDGCEECIFLKDFIC